RIGTERSPTRASASGRGARRIRRWNGRRRTSRPATASWWTSTWRSFFDRVNHDILMGLVAKRVADKRLLKLIRGFLTAGAMEGGLVNPTEEGTPQGGPLTPLTQKVTSSSIG